MSSATEAGGAQRSWFTARSVAKATGGDVLQGGATGQGVSTDTRRGCAGAVFVALRATTTTATTTWTARSRTAA